MNDRKRLIELIGEGKDNSDSECENYFSCSKCPHGENCEAKFIADHLIANGVTIQKYGRWDMKDTAYGCSLCGHGMFHPWANYCPNCGAKMEVGHD